MEVYLILAAVIFGIFALGSIIGSFLNVVALRGLSGESIVLPPSKCTKCGTKLKPWHNIPILSYLCLGGKCAFCKEHISVQYPIVEALTGLFAVAVLYKFQLQPTAILTFIMLCLLTVMSVTDIREKVICTSHAWALIIAGLLFNGTITYFMINRLGQDINYDLSFILSMPITNAIIGAIAGAIVMEILAATGYLFVKKRAFGLGDSFIAAGIGACIGLYGMLISIAFSVAVQVAFFLPAFFKKLANQKDFQTIVALTLFIITAAIVSYVTHYIYTEEICQYIMLAVLAIIGIWAAIRVIKGLKSEGEATTILPFGPAMAIGAALVVFLF